MLRTSLSVKWDLSFSCSGVRYKVFSSEIQKSKTASWKRSPLEFLGKGQHNISHLFTIFGPIALCPMHTKNVAHGIQVLVNYEDFHRSHLEGLECILNTKAVLPRVLADLIKVPPFGERKTSAKKKIYHSKSLSYVAKHLFFKWSSRLTHLWASSPGWTWH